MSDELKKILLRGYESKDLDYKAPMTWQESDKKACCELVRDILGFANTLGGYLVIGVNETETGYEWNGLTKEQAGSFETTRINRFLQNYVDPPINTVARKVTHEEKVFVLIGVPQFIDTPHICQKVFPKVLTAPTLYVRTDNNETAPIRSSSDFRGIIEQSIRNRGDKILTALRTILSGKEPSLSQSDEEKFNEQFALAVIQFQSKNSLAEKKYSGYREATFYPYKFESSRFSLEDLRSAVDNASVDFRGWPFLFVSKKPGKVYAIQDGLETVVSFPDFQQNDRIDFWRVYQSGLLYKRELMWEESYQRKANAPPAMDFRAMGLYVAEAIYCLTRFYGNLLDDDSEITLKIRVLGTDKRQITTFQPGAIPLFGNYKSEIPEISIRRKFLLEDWRTAMVDHAVEISNEIFLRFNWEDPNLTTTRDIIEKMFARRL